MNTQKTIIYALGTYRLFKNNISLEPYLSMKNDEQRILLSKLRISNHNLEIERGRHRGLQAKERICKLCLKEVEDEIHFLLQGSLCLSKLLITKLYIYMYLYVLYVKSNQSNHTN